ncbi:response regulator [Sphingomonas sp. JC676]|uniref:response regulator FixJ n=1 Tax=Sphingomonas sp. JC676 TaxID=2768065 RepID=UPI00165833B6|nr:response regulator FixJ [Sphingomonas sp. JC676]MBC9030786.1 response regulator [Sphingomonas sp. JC676]
MATDGLVYVIDDDEGARHSLEFLIDCAGFKVRTYPSADVFLQAGPPLDHACVVTDVRMPGMSGVELVAALKRRGAAVPVIMITGHADVPLAIQAMKAGVADFIEKPFNDDAILDAIRSAFAQQEGRDEVSAERDQIVERMALLSPREREVVEGLVAGHANKVIAFDLDISARTVEVYRANAMMKMQARSLSELVRMVTIARLS